MPKTLPTVGRPRPRRSPDTKQWQPPQQSAAAPQTDNPAVAIPAQLDPSLTPTLPHDSAPANPGSPQ